jgi:hypothetical protein
MVFQQGIGGLRMTNLSRWVVALGTLALALLWNAPGAQAAGADEGPAVEPEPWIPPVVECTPACRPGFTCVSGACVSPCNPPCRENERCTANAECELATPLPATPPAVAETKPEGAPGEKPVISFS